MTRIQPIAQRGLDFVDGLIDSDGSLQLGVDKEPENKIRWTAKLYIDLTSISIEVLNSAKDILNVGFIQKASSVPPEKDKWSYRISSQKGCKSVITLLQPYLRGTAREQSVIFKAAAELAVSGKTRKKEGLTQYIHLMYKINSQGVFRRKTLNEWLQGIDAETIPFDKSLLQTLPPVHSCSDEWIAGYAQGDGSFYITRDKVDQPRFCFTLIDDYKAILEDIQKALNNCGNIYSIHPGTASNNKVVYRYQVDTQNVLREQVIPVFDKNFLVGQQQERYLLWRKALELQEKKGENYKKEVKQLENQLKAF